MPASNHMQSIFKTFLALILLLNGPGSSGQNPKTLDLSGFLSEYLDIHRLPAYQEDTYCAQVSSYDTTGGNDDGFSGKYSYLRRNPDSSLVIFDMKGPGVIQRIWTPTPSDDSLDFFIDDTSRPAFTIRYRDLFSSEVYPFVAPLCGNQLGGFYCYLPIPFNNHCRIVYKGKKTQFHQIQYRLFPAPWKVKPFTTTLDPDAKKILENLEQEWSADPSVALFSGKTPVKQYNKVISLQPGQQTTLFYLAQGGRIAGFELSPASAFEGIKKDLDIRITWDQESQPAVHCPVADFFGFAFGKISMKSLMLGSYGNKNYCYFPMPFDRSAKIELIYRLRPGEAQSPVRVESKLWVQPVKRNPALEGRFYSYYSSGTALPEGKPHTLLDVTGKGHFIGTALQCQGLRPGMTLFFEGDDFSRIDGEPRMHGTGSEDYFNGGWYALLDRWDGSYSLPLSGSLDYSLPFCRTGGYRFFLADKISFEKSFYHSIEHGPVQNNIPAAFTSVTYYYSDQSGKQQAPEAKNTLVHQPDTFILYPQIASFSLDGDIRLKTRWAYPTGGQTYNFEIKEGSIIRLSLAEIPEGLYSLDLDYVAGPSTCDFSIWQRQSRKSDWVNTGSVETKRIGQQEITKLRVDRLNQTISFHFRPSDTKNQFILNRVILRKEGN